MCVKYISPQNSLGSIYGLGEGVTKDAVEAVKWYHKAAEQGDADAQFNLGMNYYDGDGVPKDDVEAYAWLNLAASLGGKSAVDARDVVEQRLGRDATLRAQQRSKELLREIEAAKNKAADSMPK